MEGEGDNQGDDTSIGFQLPDNGDYYIYEFSFHNENHMWAVWGITFPSEFAIGVAVVPPGEHNMDFEILPVMSEDKLVINLIVDALVKTIIVSDDSVIKNLLRKCVEWKLIGKVLGDEVYTPSKSPARKKAKASNDSPKCRLKLFQDETFVSETDKAQFEEENFTEMSTKVLSNNVTLTNTPDPLFTNHLLHFINTKMCENGMALQDDKCATQCSIVNPGKCVVTFRSADEAFSACSILDKQEYSGRAVEWKQQETSVVESVFNNAPLPQFVSTAQEIGSPLSTCVRISNLPDVLFQDHFLHHLNAVMENQAIAMNVEKIDECSAIVEFESVEDASAACNVDRLEYEGKILVLQHLKVDENLLADLDTPAAVTKPVNSAPKSEEELFLEECILVKGNEKKFTATQDNLNKLSEAMRSKHGIAANVDRCKSLHKKLNEQYRRNPRLSPWPFHLAFLRGDADAANPLSNSTGQILPQRNTGGNNDGGSEWELDDRKALIATLIDLKPEYNAAHRNIVFWFKVSRRLANMKVFRTPVSCSKEMSKLHAAYNNYDKERRRTGSGNVPWVYYDLLQPLLGDRVSSRAQKTFSAGGSSETSVNEALQEQLPTSCPERVGRARVFSNFNSQVKSARQEKMEKLQKLIDGRNTTNANLANVTATLSELTKNSPLP